MHWSTLPLFPTDDGWPYPDSAAWEPLVDNEIDLDELELRVDRHAFSDLTELEYFVVAHRYERTYQNFQLVASQSLGPAYDWRRAFSLGIVMEVAIGGSHP